MMTLEALPRAFVELHRAGRFDYWGEPTETLTEVRRSWRMRMHSSQMLWWNTVEWDRSPEGIITFGGDAPGRSGLIPFAGDGYGGDYCWYPAWQTGAEPPVLVLMPDEPELPLFATTFAQFLCRCFLQHFANAIGRPDWEPNVPPAELWQAHLEIMRPYLDPSQLELLTGVGVNLSADACNQADEQIAQGLERRTLTGVRL